MKVLDVKSVVSGIDQTVKDLAGVRAQVEPIQRAIRDFHSLEEDLKGQGGSAIRSFYKDTHEPFLIFLHQSLTDYENLLKEMKEAIESYESNDSGYISQAYIENEVEEGFDKVETTVTELTSDANSIIASVDDIVAIPEIDESKVIEDVQEGKNKANEIVEELIILDEFEASQLEETQDDIQTMRTLLTEMESKFANGSLSIADYDADALKDIDAYNTIKDDIYNTESEETISAAFGEDIDELPMSEIKKGKDQALGQLTESGKQKVNNAYTQLENGEIDRATYANILQEQLAEGIEQGSTDEDFLMYLVNYLDENKGDIGKGIVLDVADKSIQQTGYALLRQRVNEVIEKGIPGPEGENSFHMIDEKTANRSSKFGKWGQGIKTTSKFFAGPVLSGVGLYWGYQSDIDDGKTPGQAISHTGTSFLAGMGGTAVAATFLASNPVGLAAVGTAAALIGAGTVASLTFDLLYDNVEWIENSVDWVGDQLDTVGEAIADSALNPKNWGWG